jgi:L-ribulose-5-phosphate 4-epimerase
MHEELKEGVWKANLGLVKAGLVMLTWGNASGVDRRAGVMAIKPSGVPYDELRPEDMVVLSLENGERVEGRHRPSSDTATHLFLYQAYAGLGGIIHTHSKHATSFAQAEREIPCLGTTHADTFSGTIPVTRQLTPDEVHQHYELNTGRVIVECFRERKLSPEHVPGVLVAGHAPFAWGDTPAKALDHASVLEAVAEMALQTFQLNPGTRGVPGYLLEKHFLRKHGPGSYYGQPAG